MPRHPSASAAWVCSLSASTWRQVLPPNETDGPPTSLVRTRFPLTTWLFQRKPYKPGKRSVSWRMHLENFIKSMSQKFTVKKKRFEDSSCIASLIFPINLSHLHRLRHRRCCCRCRFCCSFHCFGHVFLDLLQLLPYWNWLEHITGLPKAPKWRNTMINCWFWGMGNVPRVCWKLSLEAGSYWSKLWVWLCKAQPLWLDDLHQEQPISTWKFQGWPTLTQKERNLA